MVQLNIFSWVFFFWFFAIPFLFITQFFASKMMRKFVIIEETNVRLFNLDFHHLSNLLVFSCIGLLLLKAHSQTTNFDFFAFLNVFVLLVLLTLFHFWAKSYIKLLEMETLMNISFWFLFAVATLKFCEDFILFLLCIEFIAAIYLFFFLFYVSKQTITFIKMKNYMSSYLFISFFTLVGLAASIFMLQYYVGTAAFVELKCVFYLLPQYLIIFLLVVLLIKIGGPGVFFFKLEIYKMFSLQSLIFFSIASLLINSIFFTFLFIFLSQMYTSNSFFILSAFLIANIVLLSRGLYHIHICQFLGISSINTWSLLLMFFLV